MELPAVFDCEDADDAEVLVGLIHAHGKNMSTWRVVVVPALPGMTAVLYPDRLLFVSESLIHVMEENLKEIAESN